MIFRLQMGQDSDSLVGNRRSVQTERTKLPGAAKVKQTGVGDGGLIKRQ